MNAHKAMIQNDVRDRDHIHAVIEANDHDEVWTGSSTSFVGGKHLTVAWKQGYSYNQIAQMTGETPQIIARILRLHKHKYSSKQEKK